MLTLPTIRSSGPLLMNSLGSAASQRRKRLICNVNSFNTLLTDRQYTGVYERLSQCDNPALQIGAAAMASVCFVRKQPQFTAIGGGPWRRWMTLRRDINIFLYYIIHPAQSCPLGAAHCRNTWTIIMNVMVLRLVRHSLPHASFVFRPRSFQAHKNLNRLNPIKAHVRRHNEATAPPLQTPQHKKMYN